jgi:hypothetical protein
MAQGCGLAIVMEVAQLHSATVNVQDASPGKPQPWRKFHGAFSKSLA